MDRRGPRLLHVRPGLRHAHLLPRAGQEHPPPLARPLALHLEHPLERLLEPRRVRRLLHPRRRLPKRR
jgi:hypothetical protein